MEPVYILSFEVGSVEDLICQFSDLPESALKWDKYK